ncbi:uncharacterized protein VTP21DRAFT_646 [Calcarisporiella thermophila]|uniref:uncharacterized protein n=1 Tax=Calcarisporiella thermophila TaxID=911321 RepID=UPI00374213CB
MSIAVTHDHRRWGGGGFAGGAEWATSKGKGRPQPALDLRGELRATLTHARLSGTSRARRHDPGPCWRRAAAGSGLGEAAGACRVGGGRRMGFALPKALAKSPPNSPEPAECEARQTHRAEGNE